MAVQMLHAEKSNLSLVPLQGNLRGPDGGQRVVLKRVKQRVQVRNHSSSNSNSV